MNFLYNIKNLYKINTYLNLFYKDYLLCLQYNLLYSLTYFYCNVSFFIKILNIDSHKKYINKFQINESKTYKDLSKGQKKQFELIMALSHHPKLLIMDEPTSSLDPIIRNEFLELMQDHIEIDNMTVFYSTHITTDLDKAADYIVMIYNGKILLKGEKDEILDNHVIVKIKKELVDNSIKKEFISLKESAFGFEGLISDKSKAYELFGDEAIYEKCTLEDILLYYQFLYF